MRLLKRNKVLATVPLFIRNSANLRRNSVALSQCQFLIAFCWIRLLFFAFIVWPVYVPIAVFILDKKERKDFKMVYILGIAIALYFFGLLATQHIAIQKINACISYSFRSPLGNFMKRPLYLLAVLVPYSFKSGYYETKWGL